MTRLALALVLLVAGGLPAQPDLRKLLGASGEGREAIDRELRRIGPRLFDVILGGLRDPDRGSQIRNLVERLPPECGAAGLGRVAAAHRKLDDEAARTWRQTWSACMAAERALDARRVRRKKLEEALTALDLARASAPEPWLRARCTVALLRAAARDLYVAVPDAWLQDDADALRAAEDRVHLGWLLYALAERAAGDDADRATALVEEARSLHEAAGLDLRAPETALPSRASVAAAEALFRVGRPAEALPLAASAREELGACDLEALERRAGLLEALGLCATGEGKRAASTAKRSARRLRRERDAERLAFDAALLVRALRLAGRPQDAADEGAMLAAVLEKVEAGAATGLELALETGLSVEAAAEEGTAAAEHLAATGRRATEVGRPKLARLALARAALLFYAAAAYDAGDAAARAVAPLSLGHRDVDRFHDMAFQAHAGAALVATRRYDAAIARLRRATGYADELGLTADELPSRLLDGPWGAPEHALLAALPYHGVSSKTRRLAYEVLERRRLRLLADPGAASPLPGDVESALERNLAELRRLGTHLGVYAPPAPDACREAVAGRKRLVEDVRRRFPRAARARFPLPVPTRTSGNLASRHRAVFIYACLLEKGGCVFAFSGTRWAFQGFDSSVDFREHAKKLVGLLEARKPDLKEYLLAAGKLHEAILAPILKQLQGLNHVFFVTDPELRGINPAVLVPKGRRASSWDGIPFAVRDLEIVQVPAASLMEGRATTDRRSRWGWPRMVGVAGPVPPENLMPYAKLVDDAFTAPDSDPDRYRLVEGDDLAALLAPEGALAGLFGTDGWLHVEPGVAVDAGRLDGLPDFRPKVLTLAEPAGGTESPLRWAQRRLLRGTDLMLACTGPSPDAGTSRALALRFWRGLLRESLPPARALARAQRELLAGRLPVDGRAPSRETLAPRAWGALQVVLRRP